MKKLPDKILPQAGVIPFRIKSGKLKILIITSSSGNKWLFPKGLVEKNMTKVESAALEAKEESGVLGEVLLQKIGSYMIFKYNTHYKVDMFPMEVDRLLARWPEEKIRKRKWVSPENVDEYIKDNQLLKLVDEFNRLKLDKNNQ
ncbi:MAG: NUDIX hydrolase [Bacteroidetes bacterium]|nr:NUDIX hydrolase [Bacteroidota bacterium]